jgi:AcrR family transcriptional regulator
MSESAEKAGEKAAKDQRRQEILDAAFAEFAEKGYAGASMEAIARRAKASKETLYAWFTNKQTLFNTLFALRLEGLNSHVAVAMRSDPSPANVLPVIAEDLIRLVIAIAPLTSSMGSGVNNPAAQMMGKTINEERKNFVNYLNWCKAQGTIAFDDDPYELTSLFVAMAQGEWVVRLSTGMVREVTEAMIHEHAQRVTRMFLKALKP